MQRVQQLQINYIMTSYENVFVQGMTKAEDIGVTMNKKTKE